MQLVNFVQDIIEDLKKVGGIEKITPVGTMAAPILYTDSNWCKPVQIGAVLFAKGYNFFMIDVLKQVAYWHKSAMEDWQVANELIRSGRLRHGLFFVQLSMEKILKAHVCLHTQDLAPRIHNLIRLAEIASIELSQQHFDILAETNSFNIEGRYPNTTLPIYSQEEALVYLGKAEEVYLWLMNQLP